MKESDDRVEKVLAGLRDIDAPPGMERRILDAIQDRASTPSRRGWRGLPPTWLVASPLAGRSAMRKVAFAAVMAVAVAAAAIHWSDRGHGQSEMMLSPARSQWPSTSKVFVKSERPVTPPAPNGRSRDKRICHVSGAVPEDEDVALREMRAPSFPPPRLPLTKQERLLLRVVHTGDPEELAMLHEEMRAKKDAESKDEFQQFFEPTTSNDNE
jgi:hypothetical protein